MENQAYYEGTEIVIRGKTYILPGLSLAQLEANAAEIEELQKTSDADALKVIGRLSKLLYLAFSRNYPDISLDEFKEMIDIRTAVPLFQSVLGESGFEQGTPGKPGEALPAAKA